MQMDHLILFHKIATEKSISKVAEECHLSQPALSQQMRKLEDEIGLRLLNRSNKGIELTDCGKVVFKYFEQMIEVYTELQEEIKNLKNYSGTIRIFSSQVLGQYALPCSVNKMSEKFPKYNFALSIMTSSEVVRKVMEGKGGIGFIVSTIENPDLVSKQIYSDREYLVCAPNFYKEESIDLDELKKYPLINLVESYSSRRILEKRLKEEGYNLKDFNTLMVLDSTESVKAAVTANLGFAFLPYMAIKKELYLKQLKIVEIPGVEIKYDLYMIYKSNTDWHADSPCVPIDVIKYFEKIVDGTFC